MDGATSAITILVAVAGLVWIGVKSKPPTSAPRVALPPAPHATKPKPKPSRQKHISAIVAGTTFHDVQYIRAHCSAGVEAQLVRNPSNTHDHNAIEVIVDGQRIGHLKRALAARLAPKMDSGANYTATIASTYVPDNSTGGRVSLLVKRI